MKLTVELSKFEYQVLEESIYNAISLCRSGCAFESCEKKANKIKDEDERYHYCDVCDFTKAHYSLEEKICGKGTKKNE